MPTNRRTTTGIFRATGTFSPLGAEPVRARTGVGGETTRTTRSRATRGRTVPQRRGR